MKLVKNFLHKNKWRLRFLTPLIVKYRDFLIKIPYQRFIPPSFKHLVSPKDYIDTAKEYILKSASNDYYYDVYGSEEVVRKKPSCVETKELEQKFEENLIAILPSTKVYVLHNVRFWGHYGGNFITPSNKLIADISPDVWGIKRHTNFTKILLPPCSKIKGKTVVISTPEAASNYWHWTFDLLPRFHLLEKSGISLNSIDNFIINHTGKPYQLESLREIGVPEEKIICCDSNSHFLLERAIVPSLCPSEKGVAIWKKDYLKNFLLKEQVNIKKVSRLYVSRQRSQQRMFENAKEIEYIIRSHSFETIYLEDYQLAEQRFLFHYADCILSIHGAGLSNLIFCKEGTKVIEIFPPNFIKHYYWFIAEILNLDYHPILGERRSSPKLHMIAENVSLNPKNFQNKLEALLTK